MLNQVIKSNSYTNPTRVWIEDEGNLGYAVCVLDGGNLHTFQCSATDLDALGGLIVGVLDEDHKGYRITENAIQNTRWEQAKEALETANALNDLHNRLKFAELLLEGFGYQYDPDTKGYDLKGITGATGNTGIEESYMEGLQRGDVK